MMVRSRSAQRGQVPSAPGKMDLSPLARRSGAVFEDREPPLAQLPYPVQEGTCVASGRPRQMNRGKELMPGIIKEDHLKVNPIIGPGVGVLFGRCDVVPPKLAEFRIAVVTCRAPQHGFHFPPSHPRMQSVQHFVAEPVNRKGIEGEEQQVGREDKWHHEPRQRRPDPRPSFLVDDLTDQANCHAEDKGRQYDENQDFEHGGSSETETEKTVPSGDQSSESPPQCQRGLAREVISETVPPGTVGAPERKPQITECESQ